MALLSTLFFVLLGLASLATVVYWSLAGAETLRTILTQITARAGLAVVGNPARLAACLPAGWPKVCIIIPAHNEREVIARVTASLCKQDYPSFHVVFVLDRCTDDTHAILTKAIGSDTRFSIIVNAACPADWAGKVNAVHVGSQSQPSRDAAILLFSDADTFFDPRCLSACVALLAERKLALLSLLSTLTARRGFELLLQPVAGFEMLTMFPLCRVNRERRRRPLANGQFLMFTRQAYDRIGGHTRAKGYLLEDLRLARLIEEHKMPQLLVMASGLLGCEMYRSREQFTRGWKRIFTELCGRKPARLRRDGTRLLVFNSLLPALCGIAILTWPMTAHFTSFGRDPLVISTCILGALGLLFHYLTLSVGLAWSRLPPWLAVLHIPGAMLISRLMREAASDLEGGVAISWGGRAYDLGSKASPMRDVSGLNGSVASAAIGSPAGQTNSAASAGSPSAAARRAPPMA